LTKHQEQRPDRDTGCSTDWQAITRTFNIHAYTGG